MRWLRSFVASLAALALSTASRAHAADAPTSPAQDEGRSSSRGEAVETRPGLLNEAASLPLQRGGYVHASGGVAAAGGRPIPAFDASALWSFVRQFAFSAAMTTVTSEGAEQRFTPLATAYAQVLMQDRAGIDLTTSLRFRALGPESAGSQLMLRANAGRSFGRAYLAVNGAMGQGFGVRGDVDFEGGGQLYARVTRLLRLGGEARARGELVDRYETEEDEGRPVDVLAGAVAGFDLQPVLVQALGGWSWPRGPYASGPSVLGSATFSF